ncbi:dTMP kinase [Nocardia amamiensis]|uniref:dTMP kinase n=1 Tax=Nocardia amamiensis TaxID=404578 RepID=UPI00082D8204|nr:thymidylate kinase [Nocardia amamiensis]
MTITPIHQHRYCTRGPLISIEGITGVGKTYLTHRVFDTLEDTPLLLEGFSQRIDGHPGLGKALLGALREASGGDPFLRGGAPIAEALILLAIKRCDLDTVVAELASGRTVVEGRSVDSTAVCQALLLHPDNPDAALATATDLLDLAASYRPLPDLTILITDDPARAVARTQQRDECVLTSEQSTFMHHAAGLYERVAAADPVRCRVLDRRTVDEHDAAEQIRAWIHHARTDLDCVREPWQGPRARCLCCGHSAQVVPV